MLVRDICKEANKDIKNAKIQLEFNIKSCDGICIYIINRY